MLLTATTTIRANVLSSLYRVPENPSYTHAALLGPRPQ